MNNNLKSVMDTFNIENFNIYSDDENYYFFRALNLNDHSTRSNIIAEIHTDREHNGETIFTEDDVLSLEEVVEHIKKYYNRHTNCISFSSNANVVIDYGRGSYHDEYVVLKVPKSEFGEDVIFAGEYMLSEITKVLNEYYDSLDEKSVNKKYFDKIDAIKTKEEFNIVKEEVFSYLGYEDLVDSLNYGSLNDEQNLLKNKIILKTDIMDNNILKKIGNKFLFSTVGMAFSSLEVIHYNTITKNITEVNSNIMDILGLLQQVKETEKIKEIKHILLAKLNNNELSINYLPSVNYDTDKFMNQLSLDNLYNLTRGHVSYNESKDIYTKAYLLAKSRLRKERSLDLLDFILNNPEYNDVLDNLRDNTYGIEPSLINRQSIGNSINISESVNLNISDKDLYIVDYINSLSIDELRKILEDPIEELYGLLDFDKDKKVRKEEWIANSIIDLIDWNYYGIDEVSSSQRKIILSKLLSSNFMDIYNELKKQDLSDKEVCNMTLLKLMRPKQEVDKKDKFTIDELEDYLNLNKIYGSGIKLKSYQGDAFRNINKAYKTSNFTSVVLPTGTGKSYVALAEMSYISEEVKKLEENRDAKILYIAPNNHILDQLKKIIVNNYRQSISESDEEIINRVFPNLTLCTYSYLVTGNNAEKIINEKYDLIIFDELHRTGATEWSSKIDKLLENQPAKVLGITATPERDVDGMDMTEQFAKKYGYSDEDILLGKHISYYMDIIEAIEKGIINDLEVLNCEYALSKDGSLEELKYKIDEIADLEEKDKQTKEYEKIRKSVLAADGIEKILNDTLKESGKYIVFIPLTPRSDGTYEETDTGEIINETRAQSMIRSYKDLMNQFLFSGEYLKENKEILTSIYNKINEKQNLSENEVIFLNKEQENILLLRRLNIKGCPNALQTFSNDLSETISEYMNWEILQDASIASILQKKMKSGVETYSMLSDDGKSRNRQELSKFNSSESKKKKFMYVMDILNEGVHVEDVDGIIWFRPLSKNSKILFKQQLGRCITAVGKENKDRIPQVIDMVNNTLKVSLESNEENLKEDLQLIKNINSWAEKNRRIPNNDSSNIEEQANYDYIKVLKKKYSKYLSEDLLEKQPVRKKIIIREIIKIGSNFDLWNYAFTENESFKESESTNEETRRDILSAMKIKGILRRFTDLYSEVEELAPTLTDEEKLFEYLQAMKDNGNRIIPQSSSLLFSDGTKMAYYCRDKKDKIYIMIMEEDNPFIVKYKEQCEVLKNEYIKYQNSQDKKISEKEKLFEYLQAMKENGNKIIPSTSSLEFSDGTKMAYYWSDKKDKIYIMIMEEDNLFIVKYKKQCEVLKNEYTKYQNSQDKKISEKEKLFEYLQAMKENGNKKIPQSSSLLFSDGQQKGQYWHTNRDKIYIMITAEGNLFIAQYKEQCEVLIKEYNNYKEKQEKKITEEEKLLEYLRAMKENDNKIIPYNSSLLFSDGTQMKQYWRNNKDKIYKMITEEDNQFLIQYKEQCKVLIKEYNNYKEKQEKKITEEEKLLEYLRAMKENDNKIIPYNSSLLFSDGTQKGRYWELTKDKIYKMIIEEGNPFIIQYKEQCEVIIKEYNKKTLSDEEKLLEYLQAMKEHGNKIIPKSSTLMFSDGQQKGQYWRTNRDKIYIMITAEGNLFIAQYKEQCEVLIKEYNNYKEKQEKKITEEEKLLEYLRAMKENDNKIIPYNSSLLFSDGTQMKQYWRNNKDKIYKMITEEDNQFVAQYKEQCEELIKEYNKKTLSDEEKLFEYLQAMKDNENKIIPESSSLLFSDGTQKGIYWRTNKDKIYKMITEEYNQFVAQYKEQCEELIKEYNKKTLSDEEKLIEYLQAMKENGNKIIPRSSSLLFSDGTQKGKYWNRSKNKIYKMITEEDNQFVAQYKDQCEVLINEYIEFQERKKKKKEKYNKVEEEFREESSFDKVLADEIRKGPNEDGKVL